MIKKFTLFSVLFFMFSVVVAQQGQGSLKGTVKDKESGEGVPFANVKLTQNGVVKGGATTDFDGKYTISSLTPGSYDIEVNSVGFKPKRAEGVIVSADKIRFVDITLETGNELEEVQIIAYQVPLIDKDGGASGGTITREDIAKLPTRSAAGIASTVGGVGLDATGAISSVRGSRSDETYYYIDGIKVRGSSGLPKAAIQEVTVMTGGVPANYGDATGGIIAVTTRGPSSFYFGGVDYLTSGFKLGENTYGLDKYAYNLLEGSISGPLWSKTDSAGNKEPILGFFLAVNATSIVNGRPFATPQYKLKDSVRDALLDPEQLGMLTVLGGDQPRVLYNSDFLRRDAFETVRFSPNVPNRGASASGKIDVNLGPNMILAFGGSLDYNRTRFYTGWGSTLFNYENNPVQTALDWRAWGRFTQRFPNAKDEDGNDRKGGVKNIFYSLMVDYSKVNRRTEDEAIGDDFFRYGYVGKFTRNFFKTFAPNADGFYEMNGYGSLLQYIPDSTTLNPVAALVAQQVANYVGFDPRESYLSQLNVTNEYTNTLAGGSYFDEIEYRTNLGLLNGGQPQNVYNMWTNFGTQYNGYSLTDNSQFRITGVGSASVGNHALQLGFEFEQRSDRFFSLSPVGLWNQARLLVNTHIEDRDLSNPIYRTAQGNISVIDYNRQNNSKGDYFGFDDPQSRFDYYLRQALGLNPDGVDFLNPDEYDPSLLRLDMFSADELFNTGNSYVGYAGYDHTGKKLRGNASYSEFFTAKDDDGDFLRNIPAFQPIYMSGFIMDKFAFDDLIFNVGVRVDRFDANQPVLKDRYLFVPANTIGDLKSIQPDFVTDLSTIPTSLSDNAVVYVDNAFKPTRITGYREGDTWYNAGGVEVTNFQGANAGPVAQPYIVDGIASDHRGVYVGEAGTALKDYDPQWIVMPRVAFSFPISDEALFFAHYDILASRPTGLQFDPLAYLFIETYGQNSTITNPDLRAQKTIDYELGFQQVLSRSSSLKISSFYREQRDYITVVNVFGAYPSNYRTYQNLDFGTVKGLTLTYDLRRTGNFRINASYTLQFAEGTGSTAESGLNFLRSGLPNFRTISPYAFDQRHAFAGSLDYRYGEGKDYNGPVVGGKQVLKNTGANIQFNFGSGTPYSAQKNFTGTATGQGSPQFTGTINGSRKPWQYRIDAQIDKNITMKLGKSEENKKITNLNIYLQVNNLFNIINIVNVYAATGNPDDDGFLASAEGLAVLAGQPAPLSFQEYYELRLLNPYNYGLPRTIRLGVNFTF
jgi:hypothetical protein